MKGFLAKILRIKPKEKTLSTKEAIEKLLQTECLLRKRADIIVAKIDEEISNAKKYGTKHKRRELATAKKKRTRSGTENQYLSFFFPFFCASIVALKALRTKKIYAQQLQHLDATLLSLEYQRETLESANSNIEVYRVVGMATQAIKTINDRIDIDTINDWNERIAEQRFLENEMKHTFTDATAKTNVTEVIPMFTAHYPGNKILYE
jgi:charged multivesicular body protein 4